jgi:hypothetical protein
VSRVHGSRILPAHPVIEGRVIVTRQRSVPRFNFPPPLEDDRFGLVIVILSDLGRERTDRPRR